jgi:hypothetical protein
VWFCRNGSYEASNHFAAFGTNRQLICEDLLLKAIQRLREYDMSGFVETVAVGIVAFGAYRQLMDWTLAICDLLGRRYLSLVKIQQPVSPPTSQMTTVNSVRLQVYAARVSNSDNTVLQYNRDANRLDVWKW